MRLLFKQRFFSWFDSYDIYYDNGQPAFCVKGELSWGHKLNIYDQAGNYVGMVKERIFRWLPTFELYIGDTYIGEIKKEFTFFRPRYTLAYQGWQVQGNMLGWDYQVTDAYGNLTVTVSKQLLNWTDTYVIDVSDPANQLLALMIVLAIDAANCSQNNN